MTWRPILSAPRDGVFEEFDGEISESGPMLLLTDGERIAIGCFEVFRWYIAEGGLFEPTHWQSLPALPAKPSQQERAAG